MDFSSCPGLFSQRFISTDKNKRPAKEKKIFILVEADKNCTFKDLENKHLDTDEYICVFVYHSG